MPPAKYQLAKRMGGCATSASVCDIPLNLTVLTDHSWLYMLMVAMDANFRLKSRLRSATNKEPSLGLGWSYFVDNGPYTDFIKDYMDEDEVCAIMNI
jgi:hypothetical protein